MFKKIVIIQRSKSFALTTLLFVMLALLICPDTCLSEVLGVDTVWSGEVQVKGKVIVDKGATLLIMPGARIIFDPIPQGASKGGGRLIVFGRLIAQGSPDEPIVFTSAATQPQAKDWEGIRFERANQHFNYISHSIVEYAQSGVNGRGSLLQIDNSIFKDNVIGVSARNGLIGSVYASTFSDNDIGLRYEHNDRLKLINCKLQNNRKAGVLCSNSGPIIQNSSFVDNSDDGIACLRGSSPLVEDNLIRGHKHGIRAEMISSPTILHNEIADNDTAISLERLSFAIVEFNLIHKNRIGLYCQLGGYPHIHNNNIIDNLEFAVDLGPSQSIDVARETPFEHRAKMKMSAPDTTISTTQRDPELVTAFPSDGLIDVYGNWWGEEVLEELQSGTSSNISVFEDGYDTPVVEHQGKTYPRDRVGFSGWREQWLEHSDRREVKYSGVSGRVLFDGAPVVGARVHVYALKDVTFEGEGITFSSPTDSDGQYSLPLKPGDYKLVARKMKPRTIVAGLVSEAVRLPATHNSAIVNVAAYTNLDIKLTKIE